MKTSEPRALKDERYWTKQYPLRMKKRPDTIDTVTYKVQTGCGALYIRITHIDGRPFELFPELGKSGGCAFAMTESLGKLTSIMLRLGVDPAMVVCFLRNIKCDRTAGLRPKVYSCADALAQTLERFLKEEGNRELTQELKREHWEVE